MASPLCWLGCADRQRSFTGDFLTEFFRVCCRKESTEEILGRNAVEEEGKGMTVLPTGSGNRCDMVCIDLQETYRKRK